MAVSYKGNCRSSQRRRVKQEQSKFRDKLESDRVLAARIWRGVKLLSKDLRLLRVTYLRHGRLLSHGGCPI